MYKNIKDVIETLLILFLIENLLAYASLNWYPTILIPIVQLLVLILTFLSIILIRNNNIIGYYIAIFLSILIIYSGLFIWQDNIITFIVKEVASPFFYGTNPIVWGYGLILFISLLYYLHTRHSSSIR